MKFLTFTLALVLVLLSYSPAWSTPAEEAFSHLLNEEAFPDFGAPPFFLPESIGNLRRKNGPDFSDFKTLLNQYSDDLQGRQKALIEIGKEIERDNIESSTSPIVHSIVERFEKIEEVRASIQTFLASLDRTKVSQKDVARGFSHLTTRIYGEKHPLTKAAKEYLKSKDKNELSFIKLAEEYLRVVHPQNGPAQQDFGFSSYLRLSKRLPAQFRRQKNPYISPDQEKKFREALKLFQKNYRKNLEIQRANFILESKTAANKLKKLTPRSTESCDPNSPSQRTLTSLVKDTAQITEVCSGDDSSPSSHSKKLSAEKKSFLSAARTQVFREQLNRHINEIKSSSAHLTHFFEGSEWKEFSKRLTQEFDSLLDTDYSNEKKVLDLRQFIYLRLVDFVKDRAVTERASLLPHLDSQLKDFFKVAMGYPYSDEFCSNFPLFAQEALPMFLPEKVKPRLLNLRCDGNQIRELSDDIAATLYPGVSKESSEPGEFFIELKGIHPNVSGKIKFKADCQNGEILLSLLEMNWSSKGEYKKESSCRFVVGSMATSKELFHVLKLSEKPSTFKGHHLREVEKENPTLGNNVFMKQTPQQKNAGSRLKTFLMEKLAAVTGPDQKPALPMAAHWVNESREGMVPFLGLDLQVVLSARPSDHRPYLQDYAKLLEKPETKRKCAAQILLQFELMLESGIIHKDIKPENILMDTQGNCLIIDLDSALWAEAADTGSFKINFNGSNHTQQYLNWFGSEFDKNIYSQNNRGKLSSRDPAFQAYYSFEQHYMKQPTQATFAGEPSLKSLVANLPQALSQTEGLEPARREILERYRDRGQFEKFVSPSNDYFQMGIVLTKLLAGNANREEANQLVMKVRQGLSTKAVKDGAKDSDIQNKLSYIDPTLYEIDKIRKEFLKCYSSRQNLDRQMDNSHRIATGWLDKLFPATLDPDRSDISPKPVKTKIKPTKVKQKTPKSQTQKTNPKVTKKRTRSTKQTPIRSP